MPSSQTSWLYVKECEGVKGPFHFIVLAATVSVAETLEQSWLRVLSHSSTVGIWEIMVIGGKNLGWNPYQILNGE